MHLIAIEATIEILTLNVSRENPKEITQMLPFSKLISNTGIFIECKGCE